MSVEPRCEPIASNRLGTGKKSWQGDIRSSSSYLTIGVQLAGSMLVYIFIGYGLDRWLKTAPWFMIVGSIVGMVAFFFQLYKLVQRLEQSSSDAHRDEEDEL